jgi:hypothetical protein
MRAYVKRMACASEVRLLSSMAKNRNVGSLESEELDVK